MKTTGFIANIKYLVLLTIKVLVLPWFQYTLVLVLTWSWFQQPWVQNHYELYCAALIWRCLYWMHIEWPMMELQSSSCTVHLKQFLQVSKIRPWTLSHLHDWEQRPMTGNVSGTLSLKLTLLLKFWQKCVANTETCLITSCHSLEINVWWFMICSHLAAQQNIFSFLVFPNLNMTLNYSLLER